MRPPSPPFPIAPTPPTADSSNRIATTQFVHSVASGGSGAASVGFASRASAAAMNIDPATPFVITGGYAIQGDGGEASYYRVGGDPGNNSGFQSADGQWWALIQDGEVNVKQFGAKGDGSTIDTVAINRAYNFFVGSSGVVVFPPGSYAIDDTIKIGVQNGTNITSFISTYTPGSQDGTTLRWHGANNKPIVVYSKNKSARMTGMTIQNTNGSTGCTGLGLGGYGPGDFGNSSLGNVFIRVDINDCETAIISGINFGCGSECTFINCGGFGAFTTTSKFFTTNDFNALDFTFINCGFSNFGIGIDTGAGVGTPINVIGGSSSINYIDFQAQSNSSEFNITGFRAEDTKVANVNGVGGNIQIDKCEFGGNQSVSIQGIFNNLIITNSRMIMPFGYGVRCQRATITGNILPIDVNTNFPWGYPIVNQDTEAAIICKNNSDWFQKTMSLDFEGIMGTDSQYSGGYPFNAGLWLPVDVTVTELNRLALGANNGTPYGASQKALCYVRHISEGPLPTMFPSAVTFFSTTGLTGAIGNNYLTYTTANPPANMTVGETVQHVGDTALDGMHITRIDVNAKRIYLDNNVAAPGVAPADTVRYYMGISEPLTRGKNIRVQAKFAASGTLAYTFTRSLNITNTGSKITATTGQFFPADKGKPIVVPGQGTNGWTNYYGHITEYIDSTHAIVFTRTSVNGLSIGAPTAATIGENEPDANWIPVGLVGNANETFWIDTIANTGCTIHSSNAASTATVNFAINR